MTIPEFAILAACLTNTIAVVGGLVVSLRNGKKIEEVHMSTNGKMEELITEVRESSFAKGVKSEKDKTP